MKELTQAEITELRFKTDKTTPDRDGYYWLLQSGLRYAIVLVRGPKYYVPGHYFGRRVSSLPSDTRWKGPLAP
jgi:hypothetical protein